MICYSCIATGLLPPDKPTNVVAEAHASGGMLVTFEQSGPGGDPAYYTYDAENDGGRSRTGRVIDAEGNDVSPFLIIADPPFTDMLASGKSNHRKQCWAPPPATGPTGSPGVEEPPSPMRRSSRA